MDPFTQGIVGVTASQSISQKKHLLIASAIGLLAGIAPDIDIFIRSDKDPLLFLEYHRHFTHSLFFIPFGSLICAFVFYHFFAKYYNLSFRHTYIYSFIGYATHGIIDAFTSYGTQLYWPLSNERVAWNTISVIDPLFSIPVALFVFIALITKKKLFTFTALFWITLYQFTAFHQKQRAETAMAEYADINYKNIENLVAKPSFGNIIVWKVIHTTKDEYHINAVRLGIDTKIIPGETIKKLNLEDDFKWLDIKSQQGKDLERFRWFSNNYLGLDKNNKNIIYDVRFSSLPNQVEGLWGIKLDENKNYDEHIEYITNRNRNLDRFIKLKDMIFNNYEN